MEPKRPRVAGVIVSYQSAGEISTALASLQAELPEGSPIVVVDQASDDATLEIVRAQFPDVVVVAERVNRGFSAGVNRAVATCPADWYLLLNPDAWLEHGAYEYLCRWTDRSDSIGGICPLVLHPPPRDTVDSLGIYLTEDLSARSLFSGGSGEVPVPEGEVFGFHGASALLSGNMLRETGGFDERYFCYMEEFDLSWRARRLGWRFMAEPQARVRHRVSASSQGRSRWREYQIERNRLWTIVKNVRRTELFQAARSIVRSELGVVRYGVFGRASWVLSAHWDALRGAGETLRGRRRFECRREPLRKDVVDDWRGIEQVVPYEDLQ